MRRFWIPKMILMILVFFAGIGAVFMLLWNWLMPYLFALPEITFWQALGLLLISKILFGLGKGGGPHHHWKNRWKNRWHHLSDEEKATWKEKFKERWCKEPNHSGNIKFPPTSEEQAAK